MREAFELSNETRSVLYDRIGRIAEEMNKSDKYLYAIQAGTETDPFAKFERLYAACTRAEAPVCHWDNKLAAIRSRYAKSLPRQTEMECLANKIKTDASTTAQMVAALKDGQIDAREVGKILVAINAERKILDQIETLLQHKQGAVLKAV